MAAKGERRILSKLVNEHNEIPGAGRNGIKDGRGGEGEEASAIVLQLTENGNRTDNQNVIDRRFGNGKWRNMNDDYR